MIEKAIQESIYKSNDRNVALVTLIEISYDKFYGAVQYLFKDNSGLLLKWHDIGNHIDRSILFYKLGTKFEIGFDYGFSREKVGVIEVSQVRLINKKKYFIDANKINYVEYLERINYIFFTEAIIWIRNSRNSGLIFSLSARNKLTRQIFRSKKINRILDPLTKDIQFKNPGVINENVTLFEALPWCVTLYSFLDWYKETQMGENPIDFLDI